jgi:hypothetical protein
MKALSKKTIEKEAALWKSLKTLLETAPVVKCHK